MNALYKWAAALDGNKYQKYEQAANQLSLGGQPTDTVSYSNTLPC